MLLAKDNKPFCFKHTATHQSQYEIHSYNLLHHEIPKYFILLT